MDLKNELQKLIAGQVEDSPQLLAEYSRDKSIFELRPQLVIFPKDSQDIKKLVEWAKARKRAGENYSLTCRSAGTDMSGGPLTDSLLLVFTKHFNHILQVSPDCALAEPGTYYREFEKETLKQDLIFPAYPASKEICALGGIAANDAGGEKSLKYGKTHNYVLGLRVVLQDGQEYFFEKLNPAQLQEKLKSATFEGEIYRKINELVEANRELIEKSRPKVAKNSSGYNIWEVKDRQGNFDLTKLFVGSQGTLGIITQIKLRLVKAAKFSKLFVVFAKDLQGLPRFVAEVLKLEPASLEATDDHTFRIYIKYAREMASLLGAEGLLGTARLFWPEFLMILRGGLPKLVILAEFEGEQEDVLLEKAAALAGLVRKYNLAGHLTRSQQESEKYWRLRRDTYRLLREKITDKVASPFIDDIIVRPEFLPEFLPKLYEILDRSRILYTVSGHIGEGNFHIIPLMDLTDPGQRARIPAITDEVYKLVIGYGGSLSAEHNDGIIRSPYLEEQFGREVFEIFGQVKKIFDPDNIFNPGKKIGASKEMITRHMRQG